MLSKDENDTCCVSSSTGELKDSFTGQSLNNKQISHYLFREYIIYTETIYPVTLKSISFGYLDSDVWFYAVDPISQKLLRINDSLTEERIFSKQAQTSLKYIVTGQLHVQVNIFTSQLYVNVNIVTRQVYVKVNIVTSQLYVKVNIVTRQLYVKVNIVTSQLYVKVNKVTGQLHVQVNIVSSQLYVQVNMVSSQLYVKVNIVTGQLHVQVKIVYGQLHVQVNIVPVNFMYR